MTGVPRMIWALALLILVVPGLNVFAVLAAAYVAGCAPGAETCGVFAPGMLFKAALDMAWFVGATIPLTIGLTILAGLGAVLGGHPLKAALSVLLLPLVALLLPVAAVWATAYGDSCMVNEGGVGDCVLWGEPMGASFHMAAVAPWLAFWYAPYAAGGAAIAGLAGWFVRPAQT